jgi:predicted DNA-binding protein with PD1-like motif
MAIADATGRTIGGHVLKGCRIYTTAELVLGILPDISFQRESDLETGYRELVIRPVE